MKFSLYQRLSLSLLLVFLAITLIFYFWSMQFEQKTRYQSKQILHLSLAANLARDNPLLQQGVYDHQALKNLFHTLMVLGPAFEFYFLDPKGNVLTHSIPSEQVKREHVDLTPLIQLTQNKKPLPIYGEDPRNLSRKKIFSAAPVFNGMQLQGYLYVIVAGERYETEFNKLHADRQIEFSLVLLATAIIFTFVVVLGLFRYFTYPLRQLSHDMKQVKSAGFDLNNITLKAWKPNSDNEVHQLGCVFYEMVDQINNQLAQLKKTDIHRRELLAEISHDLRTPLSSMQGYIETIALKGQQLSEQEKKSFIDIALKNASQLKALIDQIFELAHLEGGQVSLTLETFNIAELLYDVVAKYSLKAAQKNVSIVIQPEFSNVQVHSDIAKLERVLCNLLDNALRHSFDSSEILIEISELVQGQCQIAIKDEGTGIKAEELSYIFDPRYRASNATSGKHAGLGLAITHKLLELLNSEIKVQSKLGQGSVFSFKLSTVDVI